MFGNLGKESSKMQLLAVQCQMACELGVKTLRWSLQLYGFFFLHAGLLALYPDFLLSSLGVSEMWGSP